MNARIIVTIATASLCLPGIPLWAQEHPHGGFSGGQSSQPSSTRADLPQSQSQSGKGGKVTEADIAAGIKTYLNGAMSQAGDKKFHVTYGGKDLALDLVKVHNDRLSNLGGGKYFACVDMKSTTGTVYDLDFFLTGNPGAMRVTDAAVHKINGKPLYNWKEQNGTWKKVKV